MHMRCQTQHDYRTRMLIEETKHVKKSRIELGKERHAARQPWVCHPWNRACGFQLENTDILVLLRNKSNRMLTDRLVLRLKIPLTVRQV